MGDKQAPQWAIALKERIEAEASSVFILHFNIGDEVPFEGRFVPLPLFLSTFLDSGRPAIFYDRSKGLSFSSKEAETLFRKMTGYGQEMEEKQRAALAALGEVPPPRMLPSHPSKVLPLLEEVFQSGCFKPKGGLLVVIEYAETIVPSADLSAMGEEDRTNLVTFLRWAADPSLPASKTAILLLTANLADLHPRLRQQGSRVEAVEIPSPTYEERLAYIQHLLQEEGSPLTMSLEQLAHATAGLSRHHLKTLFKQARAKGVSLQFEEVKRQKQEILKQELSGMIEVVEPAHDLSAMGGLEPVKAFFHHIIQAIRDGDLKLVPRGILLMGPPGVGKTALAEALARECGFNFVKIINPREKWVGQSERNYWKILQSLKALTPLVVLEDEADQSEQSRDEASGDSGVSNRIRQMRFEFMGDPAIQGKVLWIRISNRPDKLDLAERRSGRGSERIPLLLPDREEKQKIFEVMPRKHGFATTVQDFSRIVELCEERFPDQLSGADIEEISLRAYRHARRWGASEVGEEDYRFAIEDFIPSFSREGLRHQELLALSLCSSRQFLPERYRHLKPEELKAALLS
ncbi:MAG: ATP-binding protein [candidate division NC10 bacterium]|nr:ATP-binding protein [candidate division NC10 bacterium]